MKEVRGKSCIYRGFRDQMNSKVFGSSGKEDQRQFAVRSEARRFDAWPGSPLNSVKDRMSHETGGHIPYPIRIPCGRYTDRSAL